MAKKSMVRSIGAVSLITLLSRVLGLVREMVRAWALGTSIYADAFSLAFSLPNLFRRLTAEGAMSNAFIPVFCDLDKESGRERALAFSASFFWVLAVLLCGATTLLIWQTPWLVTHVFAAGFRGETLEITILLTRLMFGYLVLISLAAVAQGVLNSVGVFWVSAVTPVWLNIAIIGSAVGFASFFDNPAIPFAIGVMIGGLAQLCFQVPYLRLNRLRFFGNPLFDPKIKDVFVLIVPTLFGVGVYQINILISNLIATTLGTGALSALSFSNRLLELVLGVFVVSITTVMLPRLSGFFAEQRMGDITALLSKTLAVVAFVTLPVTALTYGLADEMVSLLFQRGEFGQTSMEMTAGALRFHIIGLTFIALNRILLTAYQGAKRIKLTLWVSLVVMLVNIAGAYGFAESMGHLGIAWASSLSQMVQLACLVFLLPKLNLLGVLNRRFFTSFAISLAASLALWGGLVFLRPLVGHWSPWVSFPGLSIFGVMFYLLVSLVFRSPESRGLLARIKSKQAV